MKSIASLAVSALLLTQSWAAPTSISRCGDWTTREWDAIVVGAGTAGIIVADRLSEAGLTTLLLEQGGPSYGITVGTERPDWLKDTNMSRVDVPGLYKSIFEGNTKLTCGPEIVSSLQACATGGNSAINAGLYFQPPASDWDDYHPEGWHSRDVQPAIDRLVQRQPPVTQYSADGDYYLQTGYEAARAWLTEKAGYKEVAFDEQPDEKENVFGRPVYNYIDGQRGGPTRTYLQSALKRRNFHLQTGAAVDYIIQKGGKATGVHVMVDNQEKDIKVSPSGRVISSAGAILSPKLLMYSGIGPKNVLSDLAAASHTPYTESSSWVINENVGQGLFDNPNTFIELSGPSIESYTYSYADPPQEDEDKFLRSRSGPYTFASQTSAFWSYIDHEDGSRTGVQGTIDSSGFSKFTNNHTITLNVYGTSGMLSTGRVVLSSDGKFIAGPSSDVYYSNPRDAHDIATFIHSIFQSLPASTPDSPAEDGLTPLNLPQASTVDEIYEYITTPSAYAVGAVQHWSSSCRLGTCVDGDTKIVGTENVHVVDASIVSPLTVNPQFGIMVAAERGAEKILNLLGL
ncbi:cellobiose dehydrogenase [Emericellopsis atlantica]|uniref:Cellobiose dehydrogenase n=1 Tax=Emericellopsis atlantica TaxID=2614577 RepID=A0A9P7ZQH1_9HYPO|nr:cellobiose dehydrogenase [Emericellopsis atlantica]KAG9256241.1 cellobiose dehydrogenase [Emericellopsis atlantica]